MQIFELAQKTEEEKRFLSENEVFKANFPQNLYFDVAATTLTRSLIYIQCMLSYLYRNLMVGTARKIK